MKHLKMGARLAALSTVLLLNACVPSLESAQPLLPTSPIEESRTAASLSPTWREFYPDTLLQGYVAQALSHNLELAYGQQQVLQSHYLVQGRSGAYLPFLRYTAGAEREKVGEYTRNGSVERQLTLDGAEFPEPLNNFGGALVVGWELDIWNALHNEKKAAQKDYLASEQGLHVLQTQVVARVAQTYYELLVLDQRRLLIEQTIEVQQKALRVVLLQKQAGEATELAVKRFEAELSKNKSELYVLQQEITEREREMNYLTGQWDGEVPRNVASLERLIRKEMDWNNWTHYFWTRPDVQRAELELEAARLDVKSARAEFLPQLGVRAKLGLDAFKPSYLTELPQSLAYNLAGDLAGPLVNRKAIKAHYQRANSRQIQALVEYERTLLEAYVEVLNSASRRTNLTEAWTLKQEQVRVMLASNSIASTLFQNARADYLEVLLVQREALEAQQSMLELELNLGLNQIIAYKQLGGGWR